MTNVFILNDPYIFINISDNPKMDELLFLIQDNLNERTIATTVMKDKLKDLADFIYESIGGKINETNSC